MTAFFENLKPNFLYTTVIQHDQGMYIYLNGARSSDPIKCGDEFVNRFRSVWENQILLFGMSAGHVPIPLAAPLGLSDDEDEYLGKYLKGGQLNEYLLGWSGTMWDIRTAFSQTITKRFDPKDVNQRTCARYRGDQWPLFGWGCCKFMVTLRGRGPTTFSMFETIELSTKGPQGTGALPLYVWSGVKWLPYRPLWSEFCTTVEWKTRCDDTIDDIFEIAQKSLRGGESSSYERKRKWLREHFEEYFTFQGIMQQIQWTLVDGPYDAEASRSKLHCEGKPNSETDRNHKVHCE